VFDGKADFLKTHFVNSTSFGHLEIETCTVDNPVDFYVAGISPRNPKKAVKGFGALSSVQGQIQPVRLGGRFH